MSTHIAVIPNCDIPTPIEVRKIIPRGLQVLMVGVVMSHNSAESFRDNVEKLTVGFSAMLTITNAMHWDVAPLLRKCMATTRNFTCTPGTEERWKDGLDQESIAAIDVLLAFCNKESEQE
jgi:hypothetical protein